MLDVNNPKIREKIHRLGLDHLINQPDKILEECQRIVDEHNRKIEDLDRLSKKKEQNQEPSADQE